MPGRLFADVYVVGPQRAELRSSRVERRSELLEGRSGAYPANEEATEVSGSGRGGDPSPPAGAVSAKRSSRAPRQGTSRAGAGRSAESTGDEPDLSKQADAGVRAPKPGARRRGRWLRFVGWASIALGLVVLEFAAFLVWGTGLATAREQGRLRRDFEAALERNEPSSERRNRPVLEAPPLGEPLARLEIPAIGVDAIVVEGVGHDELAKGPGHIPETALPGRAGNSVISGHRTTYGAPFWSLDELEVGDEIRVSTIEGVSLYRVVLNYVVLPADTSVTAPLKPGERPRLRLTTCHPRFSAAKRLVVEAELVTPPTDGSPCTWCSPSGGAPRGS